MGYLEDFQNQISAQAQQAGAQAAQGAIGQIQAAIPELAHQAQEHLAAQVPVLQQTAAEAAHQVGREAGAGAKEGLLAGFSTGETVLLGVGALAAVGLLGFAAWKSVRPAKVFMLSKEEAEYKQFAGRDLRGRNFANDDLSNASFDGADLSGVNLTGADLSHAFFNGANLSGVNAEMADLSSARLRGARVRGANLISARAASADLSGANLAGAYLWRTDLSDSDLTGTRLAGAMYADANFAGARRAADDARIEGWRNVDAHLVEEE